MQEGLPAGQASSFAQPWHVSRMDQLDLEICVRELRHWDRGIQDARASEMHMHNLSSLPTLVVTDLVGSAGLSLGQNRSSKAVLQKKATIRPAHL